MGKHHDPEARREEGELVPGSPRRWGTQHHSIMGIEAQNEEISVWSQVPLWLLAEFARTQVSWLSALHPSMPPANQVLP